MKDLPDVVLALGGLGLALFCPPAFALPTGPRLCAPAAEASFVPVGLDEHRGGIPGVSHFSSFSALGFVHRFVRSISVSSLPRSIGLDLWMASRFVRVSIPSGGRAFSRSLSIGSGSDVSMHVFVRSDAGDVPFRVRCLWVRVRFFDVRGGVSLFRSFRVRSRRRPTRGSFRSSASLFSSSRVQHRTARIVRFVPFGESIAHLFFVRSSPTFRAHFFERFCRIPSSSSSSFFFFFFCGVGRVVVSFVPVRRSGIDACASVSSSYRSFRSPRTWVCLFLPSFFVSRSCRVFRFVSHHVRSSSRWVARLTSSSHSASTARTSSSLAPVTSIILSTVFFLAFPPSPCALLPPPPPPSPWFPFSLRFVAMVVCR